MIKWPGRLSGQHPLAQWLNQLRDACISAHPLPSDTVKVKSDSKGTSFRAARPAGGAGESSTLKKLYYVSSRGDYIWCADIKTTQSGTAKYTAVAKTYKLRNSILTETIDGTVVNYAYGAYSLEGQKYLRRDATIAGNSVIEKQDINPRFLVNDEIWVEKPPDGTGVMTDTDDLKNTTPNTAQAVEYIDCNRDARMWTQRDDQST